MKASEVRAMPVDELNEKLVDLKEELFNLRFQLAANQLENTARIKAVKKDIAHEEARINAMLEGLAQKKDLIFVRNGDEHTCDEAVSHLRLKLGNTRNRIDTAEQFIDKVASSSSITGKPYIVKIPGKSDENAQPFLHALIAQTDKTVPAQ